MNSNTRSAMIGVVILTVVGVVASVIIFATTGNTDTQRSAIFTGTLFGFLAPTIGVLLLVVQTKTVVEKAQAVEKKVDTVATLVNGQHTELLTSLTEAQKLAATPQELKARENAPVIGMVLVQPATEAPKTP